MQELKRIDYAKLEDYLEHINKYKKDLKFREYELLSNHDSENKEGGKGNLISNPVERQVIMCEQDAKYKKIKDIVEGTQRFLKQCDNETLEIFRLIYWDKPYDCNTWNEVADRYYTSKSSMLRYRDVQLEKLSQEINYV
ncbi:transcriptional regulator [Staphylococcus saprophyticus]|nr:transcriptional regulator [Staphylococcus saprophyticus]